MRTLDIARIKALCFDVDGTLSNTDDLFVLKIARWLVPFRFLFPYNNVLPFTRKLVMMTETPGNYLSGIPDQLGIDDEIANFGNWIYQTGLGKSPTPFLLVHRVKETLEYLQSHYKMSIVSARGEKSTQRFLEQFDLTHYFQAVATAQTCNHKKPYPDPIVWAAGKMGVSPTECLMIGDTTVDILAARAAGAQSVGVLCGFGEKMELETAGADLILEQTAMLMKILPGKP